MKIDWLCVLGIAFCIFMLVFVFPAASRKEEEFQIYKAAVDTVMGRHR